jgi:hypothetical protein
MHARSEMSMAENLPANTRPIELVTENGFSILRPWEIGRVPPPMSGSYPFLVRNPQSLERVVVVKIADDAIMQIELQTRLRILLSSPFWICCAERHLATYVYENDDYPPGDRLRVEQLSAEECMSAIRWGTTWNAEGSGTDFSL